MTARSPKELLQWLVEKQFLPKPQADEMEAILPDFVDTHALVKELVKRNWLTPFQANLILQEKAETLVLGSFRFLERLGEGSMGQVFKAWNVRMGRFVAIKMIHKDHLGVGKVMDRFRQEMETAGQLEHPNIVRVRDADEIENRPFMVMDYFEGTNLSRLVKSSGPVAIPQACEYVRQTALGLQHAFERGVVHRDIKPSNLLLTHSREEQTPVVKILDFGLGRYHTPQTTARLTQADKIIGTIDYISPEQVENPQKADHRSDIYSLGCTLFFLVTAKPPFPGTNVQDKLLARMMGEIPSMGAIRPEVPASLETVQKRMMARSPDQRYQAPIEVAHDLANLIQNGFQPLPESTVISSPSPVSDDPFAFGTNPETTGKLSLPQEKVDFSAPRKEPNHSRPPKPKGMGSKVILGAMGMILLVAAMLAGAGVWFLGGGKETAKKPAAYPGGSLRLILPGDFTELTLKEGDRKVLILRVERKGFIGPVKIQVKNLPEGVTANPITIKVDADKGELQIRASYSIGGLKTKVKLQASAEELQAEEILPLTVVSLKD